MWYKRTFAAGGHRSLHYYDGNGSLSQFPVLAHNAPYCNVNVLETSNGQCHVMSVNPCESVICISYNVYGYSCCLCRMIGARFVLAFP